MKITWFRVNFVRVTAIFFSAVSGLIGATLLSMALSGKMHSVDMRSAIAFNTSLQLCLLMVTLLKLGADSIILAKCDSENKIYDYQKHFFKVLPISIILVFVVGYLQGALSSCLAFAAIIDTYSILKVAELNAKRRSMYASIAGLFYTPVAFAVFIFGNIDYAFISFSLLAGSVARFIYVFFVNALFLQTRVNSMVILLPPMTIMLCQQLLNYLLFRSDQLVIGFLYDKNMIESAIAEAIFWSKSVEIYTAATLIITSVYFPFLNTGNSVCWSRLVALLRINKKPFFVSFFGVFLIFAATTIFLKDGVIDLRSLPFILQATLIVPANLVTFIQFRSDKVRNILASSAASLAVSAAFVLLANITGLFFVNLFIGSLLLLLYIIFSTFFDRINAKCSI